MQIVTLYNEKGESKNIYECDLEVEKNLGWSEQKVEVPVVSVDAEAEAAELKAKQEAEEFAKLEAEELAGKEAESVKKSGKGK